MPRFSIVVKNSHIQIAEIIGRTVVESVDPEDVVDIEQFLERLTGFRFHIMSHVDPRDIPGNDYND